MSFQPQMPIVNPPPPSAPAPPPPPVARPPAKGKRRKGLMIFGLILLLAGIFGGGAVVAKGASNYESAVKSLARAPVGCTTTLVFDKPSTYTVYVETKGALSELSGDCEANGDSYTHPGDRLPRVSMSLVDSNGEEVDLQRGVTASYDIDDYEGTAIRTARIPEAGTYRLNVESEDSDFAVSIGKNPKEDNELMLLIGGSIALGGLVLGLLFFLLGLRRRRPDPALVTAAPLPSWPPGPYTGAVPTGPPGLPSHPGYRPETPPPSQPPGQPPIRLPETPPGGSFAPPTLAPPSSSDVAPGMPNEQWATAPRYLTPTNESDGPDAAPDQPTLPTLPPTRPSGGWTTPDPNEPEDN